MPHRLMQLLLTGFFLCLATPALAQKEIVLTMDPTSTPAKPKPTVVDDTINKKIQFKSIDAANDLPQPFKVIFEPDFKGNYDTSAGKYTEGKEDPITHEITFESGGNWPDGDPCVHKLSGSNNDLKCQAVSIKLLYDTPGDKLGFLYRIEMGGGTIDPRIRGN